MQKFHKRYLNFCHPLIKGLQHIYADMARTNIRPKTPYFKEGPNLPGDVSSIIELSGKLRDKEFQSVMLLSWPLDTYLKTASKILNQEYIELADSIRQLGEEICQMVIGKADPELQNKGYQVKTSATQSLKGRGAQWESPAGFITIVTPMDSWMGRFFVELNYSDTDLKNASQQNPASTPLGQEADSEFDVKRAP